MGLLDNFNFDDPRTMGLLRAGAGMMAQAGDSSRQFNPAQAASFGMDTYAKTIEDDKKRKMAEEIARQQAQMQQMQMDEMRSSIDDKSFKRNEAGRIQQVIASMGDDYQGMLRAGVPAEIVKSIAESKNFGRAKVARTMDVAGVDGGKITRQFDDYGNPVGGDQNAYVAPQAVNQGDKTTFVTPMAGLSLKMGVSPSDAMTQNRFDKQLAQSERHFQAGLDKPVFNADLGGFVSQKNGFLPLAGIPAKTPKLTEDQGKATGWLVQAENAIKNMMESGTSGKDANGKFIFKSASSPGFNDALAAVPSFGATGGIANMMRSSERQKFLQASSSASEALLRAATGAGVNKDEAAQKIAEITPQVGDSDEVKQQKFEALPLYLESLKVRAGAGAAQASNVIQNFRKPVSSSGTWGIERVK